MISWPRLIGSRARALVGLSSGELRRQPKPDISGPQRSVVHSLSRPALGGSEAMLVQMPGRRLGRVYASAPVDRASTAILAARNSAHNSGHSAYRRPAETHKRTALSVIYLQSRRSTYRATAPSVDKYNDVPSEPQECSCQTHSE